MAGYRWLALLLSIGTAGCADGKRAWAEAGLTKGVSVNRASSASQANVSAVVRPAEAPSAPNHAPPGYLRVLPAAEDSDAGPLLLLAETTGVRVLPIFINGTEGYSIKLRLTGNHFNRPLTHDLLDEVVRRLGAKVLRAQVDRLTEGVYHATLVLKRGNETIRLDARPSDAVAIAIGHDAPIFAAESVLEAAGHDPHGLIPAPHAPHGNAVSL